MRGVWYDPGRDLPDGLYTGSWWAQDTMVKVLDVGISVEKSPFTSDKPVRVSVRQGHVQVELFSVDVEDDEACQWPWVGTYPLSGQMVEDAPGHGGRLWCVAKVWQSRGTLRRVKVDTANGAIVLVDVSEGTTDGEQYIRHRDTVRPVGFSSLTEVAEAIVDVDIARNQDED